ncbi:MAG: hypothetical protein GXP47_00220 [Acidobacteria bacterium]|nr:hypothetical protein [Acidobacteriota bacterium]
MGTYLKDLTRTGIRALTLGLLLTAVVLGAMGQNLAVAAGTHLYSYTPPLVVDSTNKGDVWICYDRPKRPAPLHWGNKEYMILDAATDVQIWDPGTGTEVAAGHFGIGSGCSAPITAGAVVAQGPNTALGNDGFEDVNICDECRFGVANTADGLLVFDLGTPNPSGKPQLKAVQTYAATQTGGTYKVGNTQYVVVGGDYGSPFAGKCPSGQMGVYTFSPSGGISATGVCISDVATFHPKKGRQFKVLSVAGGLEDFYIYRQSNNHDVNIVKLASDGTPILPPINATPFNAGNFDYFSLDTYDLADDTKPPAGPRGYLLITNAAASPYATVYELTPDGNGGLNISTLWSNSESVTWDIGAIHYPYVFLNVLGNPLQPRRLLDISTDPATFIDFDYWNDPEGDEDYNTAGASPGKAIDQDAYFSPDGQWLYFARFYQMSRFKFTPSDPTAAIVVTPSPAFWGDQALVDGGGSGGAAEYSVWIDDKASGTDQNATVYAGTPPWNNGWGTATSVSWQIPNDGSTGPYYGHVAVQDTARGYSYDPVAHPEMLANQQINLDTTPQPKITINGDEGPFTVFIGDTRTLSATNSDGNPSSYLWEITSPSNMYTGQNATITQVFDEQGTWNVSLDVAWVNGEYTDTATTTVTVKSALADFTFSPSNPKDNEAINLDASASKPSGQLSYNWEVLNGTSPEWTGSGVTATIPKDTLVPGSYTIRLTVLNASTNESDTLEKTLSVISGASQISISPTDPERGQTVTFAVQGISGITGINWHFGGASCDGTPADQTCTGQWCTPAGYTYRDAGTYSVRADVITQSGTTSLYGTVNVQNVGSCPAGSCTYSSSITNTSFSASGGNAAVTVGASSSSCPWTVSSSQTWLSLGQTSGTGSANISFTVGSNSGGTRSASITVRGGSTFTRTFSITQSGSGGGGGGGSLSINPESPKKGEAVTFAVQGISGINAITWHFGGASCDGSPADQSCTDGIWCTPASYTYRDAGTKSVSAVVSSDSGTQTVTGTVTVQNDGQCSGGACSYSVQASATSFGPNGGTGTVNVTADSGCAWNATTTQPSWLHITGVGSGNGNGSFSFSVDKYTGTDSRNGNITVRDQSIKITQSGVSKGDFLVSAAASIPGEKGTYWQTDLCIFNPDTGLTAKAHVVFLPESLGQVDPVDLTPGGVNIPRLGTLCLQDVLGTQGDTKGALRVKVDNAEQLAAPVVVTSRTYTKQGDGGVGTYGQNVPGRSVSTVAATRLVIGGLHHYQDNDGSGFRTAIGLVNQTDKTIGGIVIHLYDDKGNEVGSYETGLYANGFLQVDRIVEKVLGPGAQLKDFSVVIRFKDAQGVEGAAKELTAYASMVDDVTGDAVFIQGVPIP